MITTLNEFTLCPHCGSIEYLENYPTPGISSCTKCGHEIVKIPLKELPENDIDSQSCPFCGKESEQIETLYEDDFVLVFKCKNCKKLEGYRNDPDSKYNLEDGLDESYFSGKDVAIARKEGKYTLDTLSASKRAEIVKALKEKEKNPKEKCKQQLHKLLREKNHPLKVMGITKQTITGASDKAQFYIEKTGALTEKQLLSLICGSITYEEDVQFRRRDINKRHATERNLAELFNVDRKTVRKWKNLLKKGSRPPKWGIHLYQENGSLEFGSIEITKDSQAVAKLEKPYKGTCCLFDRDSELIWRIKFSNGCWSDICQPAYELFKKTYWEYEGHLNLP